MKSFVIKSPVQGKTTCALVRQFYCTDSQRTKTEYLGSFNTSVDPTTLPKGVNLRPQIQLESESLEEIRRWLTCNGTYGAPPVFTQALLDAARQQILREQTQQHQTALDSACHVLHAAALEVRTRAAGLRNDGMELSAGFLTYTGVDRTNCTNSMDRLKVDINCIRAAVTCFEKALQEARLLKRVNKLSKSSIAHAPQ